MSTDETSETLWSSGPDNDESNVPGLSILSPAPILGSSNGPIQSLSETQTEKFRTYLDEELLQISRKYIQRIKNEGFTDIGMLLNALNKITDIIWYSIGSSTHYGGLFEIFYLIRIADGFSDQLIGYKQTGMPPSHPKEIIRFLQKLDNIFAELIEKNLLSQTDCVRLESIADRSRMAMVNAFTDIRGYEIDVSKVYENTLERMG